MVSKVLSVTGVPCSGKTTLCSTLGVELQIPVLDLTRLVDEEKLYSGIDEARDTKVVDVEKLRKEVKKLIKDDTILDGLLSHHMDVTHILVLRCDPKVLAERMAARGYGRKKIMENLEAEYGGVILYESLKKCGNVLEVDNINGADLEEIKKWFREGGRKVVEKDWTNEFESVLRGRSPI
ncbi:MAG: adenylate kinase family protein [Candidatus Altiarchaeota archaeon]